MTQSSDHDPQRRQLLTLLGATSATGLAGCISIGGNSDDSVDNQSSDSNTQSNESDSDQNSDPNETTTAEMAQSAEGWSWNIAARSLQDAAEMYNEEFDADISVEELGGDAHQQRFQTALTSGSGAPDFSSIQNYDVAAYADINGLMDLTDRIEETNIKEDIVESQWRTCMIDDRFYAIPWGNGPTGIFYKRDRYEEAGIDTDSIETWDDFIEAGQQMPDDVSMVNLPPQEMSSMWRMLFRQLGGQAFTEDGAVNIHSEDSIRVAQLIQDLQDSGITTRVELWSGGWFTAFSEGSLASLPTAAWMDGTLRAEIPDTAGNWGVYKLPAFEEGGNRASNRGGSNMAIPAQIEDEAVLERAYHYCLWAMTTPEVQNMMLEDYGLFPTLKPAYDADIYDEELDFYDGQPVFRLFAEVSEEIEPYRYTVDTPEVQDAIETELGNLLDNNKSPEAAMQDAAETVSERTDRDLA